MVCKIKGRSRIHSPNVAYQEDEVLVTSIPITNDELGCLRHENGEIEEHNVEEELAENDNEEEVPRHENCEVIEESDFESSEDEEEEQSDENVEYNDSANDEDNEE